MARHIPLNWMSGTHCEYVTSLRSSDALTELQTCVITRSATTTAQAPGQVVCMCFTDPQLSTCVPTSCNPALIEPPADFIRLAVAVLTPLPLTAFG